MEIDISWDVYHASKQPVPDFASAITALLHLFPDDSKSAAIIHYVMDVIRNAALVELIEDMGNSFSEENVDLLKLDTKDIADSPVIASTKAVEKIGQQQYTTFIK
ncbi:unnamed protein product [Caretta caretta]